MKQKQKPFFMRIVMTLMLTMFVSIPGYGNETNSIPGQEDLVITYDYLKDEPSGNVKYTVKHGKNVMLRVVNVNPFLFKVTIDGKPFNYFPDVPKAFDLFTVEMMGTDGKQKDSATAVKELKESTKGDIGTLSTERKEKIDTEFGKIDSFIAVYRQLPSIMEFNNAFRLILLQNKAFDDLQTDLLTRFAFSSTSDIYDAVVQFKSLFEEANRKYGEINFKWLEDESGSNPKLKYLVEQLKIYKKQLDKMKIDNVIGAIDSMVQKFQPKNFERSSLVSNVDTDEVRFTVSIEPLNKEDTIVYREIIGPIRVRVKSGWTVNFSTGLLTTIDPWTRDYILADVEDEEGKVKIVEKEKTTFTPTVAALMHVYPRWAGTSGIGWITFGIGTKDTEQISYYLGLSWIFGVKRRFILSAGVTLAKFNVLKSEYEVGQVLKKDEKLKAENLVQKEFKPRIFIGLSFNLAK